jgi:uncharacterized tellurite resistance protein B-like protein
MSLLRRLFGAPGAPDFPAVPTDPAASNAAAETATVRRIVADLEALPPERARFVAASAYVLARVANADFDMSAAETTFMEQALVTGAGIPEAEAVLVVEAAKQQARLFGSTEDYLVTREFLRISTAEERSRLLRGCFLAAAADDSISSTESATLNEIASEIQVPATELAALREEFGDRMSVVRAIRAHREG